MAFNAAFRIRRALSLSSTLLQNSFNRQPKRLSPLAALFSVNKSTPRHFTSTSPVYFSSERRVFNPDTDEIGPDTILFEGCDYNHWLITVDFPKDQNVTREQMIETYVNTAAQVFGSVEEAKKKIYALSTTTYQGFQVECSEETSKKFDGLPGVVFILPDSYIDPNNKEYGGDKYVNGEIYPRPIPVRNTGNRRQSYGPPQQQSYNRPPQSQNYGPPRQQNYGPPPPGPESGPRPPRQDFGPAQQQQTYGPSPPQQNFERTPPQQNFERTPPKQHSYAPPQPQQHYTPPPPQPPSPQQSYGPPPSPHSYGPPPQQHNYQPAPPQHSYQPPPPQHSYGPPPPQQNYGPPPQNNYTSQPPQQHYSPPPPPQHGQGQIDFQRDDFQNNVPSERRY